MSFYHFKARYVSRSKQSAVAKAAYVSNDALYSERDEELKKYRTRPVKPESFILAPSHAPNWVHNREKLWNEVEKVEKQYNSQLLREIEVALPSEMSNEEQRELVERFVKENFVDDGMVADVNIHRDKEHNPHAHILLTIRPFDREGNWFKNKTKKVYLTDVNGNPILNEKGKQKTKNIDLTGWNDKQKLIEWRKNFAEKINEYYKKNDIKKRVSHLSYEKQGLDKSPKHRLTRNEFFLEKRVKEEAKLQQKDYVPVTHYAQMNLKIDEYNREIEKLNKEIKELEERKIEFENTSVKYTDFTSIRENYVLNDEELKQINFIKKRQKTNYVDYEVSSDSIERMHFWKRSIETKILKLNREEEALKTVKSLYEKNDDRIYKYGFSNEDFVLKYNEKMSLLNDKFGSLSAEFEKYKESFELVKKGQEVQKKILHEEFKYLYPQYDIAIDSFEINEIKNKYVTKFKKENNLLDTIPEFDSYDSYLTEDEQKFRDKIWDMVSSYRRDSRKTFSLSNRVSILENEYRQLLDTEKHFVHKDEIYNKAIEYLSTKRESEVVAKSLNGLSNEIYNTLIELYGEKQKHVIGEMPDRFRVSLLERFLKEREVNNLSKDLEDIHADAKFKNKDMFDKNEKGFFVQNNRSIGNLLTDLIENAKKDEGKYDDLEKKRRKNKKGRKLTKEEINKLER